MTPLTLAHLDARRLSSLFVSIDASAAAGRLDARAVGEVLRHWTVGGAKAFEVELPLLDAWLSLAASAPEPRPSEVALGGGAAFALGLALGSLLVLEHGREVVGSSRGFRRALRRIARMQNDDDALESAMDPALHAVTLRAAQGILAGAPSLRRVLARIEGSFRDLFECHVASDGTDMQTLRVSFLMGLVGAGVATPERRQRVVHRV